MNFVPTLVPDSYVTKIHSKLSVVVFFTLYIFLFLFSGAYQEYALQIQTHPQEMVSHTIPSFNIKSYSCYIMLSVLIQ